MEDLAYSHCPLYVARKSYLNISNDMWGNCACASNVSLTFAFQSLRAGMDLLHLRAQDGWGGLELVKLYAQLVEGDLIQSHKATVLLITWQGCVKISPP